MAIKKIMFEFAPKVCHQHIEGTFTAYAEDEDSFYDVAEIDGYEVDRIRILKIEDATETEFEKVRQTAQDFTCAI